MKINMQCPENHFLFDETAEGIVFVTHKEGEVQAAIVGGFSEAAILNTLDALVDNLIPQLVEHLHPIGKLMWISRKEREGKVATKCPKDAGIKVNTNCDTSAFNETIERMAGVLKSADFSNVKSFDDLMGAVSKALDKELSNG